MVNPTVDDGSIVEIPDALKEVTPTVWLPFNWDNVDANPEIDITSPSEKVWNGKTVKFNLRKGVKWHDGKPFTSADVKFTIMEVLKKVHPQFQNKDIFFWILLKKKFFSHKYLFF